MATRGMMLHKPGSAVGLQLTAEGAVAYDWKTKDLPETSARQTLSDWSKEAPASDGSSAQRGRRCIEAPGSPGFNHPSYVTHF